MSKRRQLVVIVIALVIDIAWPYLTMPTWVTALLIGVATYAVGYWITGIVGMD